MNDNHWWNQKMTRGRINLIINFKDIKMNKMYMQFDGNKGFLTYSLKAYDPGIH